MLLAEESRYLRNAPRTLDVTECVVSGQSRWSEKPDSSYGLRKIFRQKSLTNYRFTTREKATAMDLSQTLLQLEQRLLSQSTRRDCEEICHLLADDFIEFGASGTIWNKAEVVEQLPQENFTQRTISQFAVKPLSEHTALVTYHCHADIPGQRCTIGSLRSSIWRRRGEQWQMVSHQGTTIPQS